MEFERIWGLAAVLGLGVLAHWLAWWLHLPSIALLLLVGLLVGPGLGWLHPDELLGDLLLPFVSLSVAVVLFEGGLSLKLRELRDAGPVVVRLVTVGALLTGVLSAWLAYTLLGLDLALAALLGSVLVVTGPTVIVPLLRHIRPSGRVGAVAKWEGIVNDPIGALLAVLVFEAVVAGEVAGAVRGALLALLVGGGLGAAAAQLLVRLFRRYWVPDYLQIPLTLAVVISVYVGANAVQGESGLLAVTLLGIVLANQREVVVQHIVEFKETVRVILLAGLFILLAARVPREALLALRPEDGLFLLGLIVLVRPLAVAASTWGSRLTRAERILLMGLAPRGIVAAAVASVFALRLEAAGHPEAERLIPVVFGVILGTVAVYGLSAGPLARRLGLATPNPQGALIVGAHAWARELAEILRAEGFPVLLLSDNRREVREARLLGLPAVLANVLSESAAEEVELGGLGRLLALTPNDEVNALAALHFVDAFGRREVYQLPPQDENVAELPAHLRGRFLFAPEATYGELDRRFRAGHELKRTPLTEEFPYERFLERYGQEALPLFLVRDGKLLVFTVEERPTPRPGDVLIHLAPEA